jgi:hypothetical protein
MRTFAQKPKIGQQTTSVKSTTPRWAFLGQSRDVQATLQLQRAIGKQATRRFLEDNSGEREGSQPNSISSRHAHDFSRIPIHAKADTRGNVPTELRISQPNDLHEQEANRAAHQVMGMAQPQAGQRSAMKETNQLAGQTCPGAQGGGQPLPQSTREFFEPRFAQSFSDVRMHHDLSAHEAADSIGARAFTYGNRIVFGRGAYSPFTVTGRQTIAHELAHVLQSSDRRVDGGRTVPITSLVPSNMISRQAVTVNDALRERIKKCVDPFYYDQQGNWSWGIDPKPNCSDVKIPADRKRAWRCLNSMYWSRDGTKWDWFGKEPKCDDLTLPAPISQIRGETPAETKTRKAEEKIARQKAERIAKEDAHNVKRIEQIKQATSTDVAALARIFTDSKIKDDGTLVGRFTVIFRATEHWAIRGLQTGIKFGFSGFKKEFQDPWPSSSNQVGHFLTAVRLAMDSSVTNDLILIAILDAWFDDERALRLIIGHEKRADPGALDMSVGFREQYKSTTKADIENFKKGDLSKIKVGKGKGNSMADLALSYKGWLLGRMVAEGKMKSKQEVSNWILRVLR